MRKKQREALLTLYHEGRLINKQWDLWARLSQSDLVKMEYDEKYRVTDVTLTDGGRVFVEVVLLGKRPRSKI